MNIDQVQKKILKCFPNDSFKIIEYTNMKNPMILQCNKCNKIFTFQRAENFFRRKNGCNNCQDTFEWKKQKEKFLLWLQEHNEFKLIDDLDQIHSSQTHIRCQCTLCGRIQENKSIYDYYANKKCFCQAKGAKKSEDQLKKDFENICIFLEEYRNTDTPILVKSLFCGHEFKVAPRDILRKPYLCPICNSSHGEKKILFWLENNKISYCRQHKIKNYKVDFYLPLKNIVIEFNGIQHYKPVTHFGGQEKFIKQQQRDNFIREFCNNNQIKLIEISYLDYDNIDKILKQEVL